MKATFKLVDVNTISAEMTLTMQLVEWKHIRQSLDGSGLTTLAFRQHIDQLVERAEQEFYQSD